MAQEETATLSGRVLDATDDAPVGFASVVVENADSGERLTGTLTGEDGRFLVQGLAPGEYKISLSFPGFYPVEADLLVGELNQSFDLGDIHLLRLEDFTEEITVTAGDPGNRARHSSISARRRTDPVDRIAARCDEEPSWRDGRSRGQGLASWQ